MPIPTTRSIATGATMARYAAEGAQRHAGDLHARRAGRDPRCRSWRSSRPTEADQLGGYRIGELAARDGARSASPTTASSAGPGRLRDSGMMGTPANDAPAGVLAGSRPTPRSSTRRWRPLVAGDPRGAPAGGRHLRRERRLRPSGPHHGPPGGHWPPSIGPRRSGVRQPASRGRSRRSTGPRRPSRCCAAASRRCATTPSRPFGVADVDDLPFGIDDELSRRRSTPARFAEAKMAALRAHRTQITVDGSVLRAVEHARPRGAGTIEHYRLVQRRARRRARRRRARDRPVRRAWADAVQPASTVEPRPRSAAPPVARLDRRRAGRPGRRVLDRA